MDSRNQLLEQFRQHCIEAIGIYCAYLKASPETTTTVTSSDVVSEAEPEAAPEPETEISYEDVKTVVLDLCKAKGRPQAERIFKDLGAKNLPTLDKSKYGKYIAEAKKLMG